MSDKAISSTTQEFLDVYDITNDMVILKNGTVSVIIQVGTMNFSLLAEQEQDAIMYTYGALLNSLNYAVQINIQSSIKDASRYLRLLDEQAKKSSSQKKAGQITRYRNFVGELIHQRNVLEKKFFAVIPATVGEMGLYSAKNVLPGKTEFDINTVEKTVIIEKAANILDPRRDHLISQFNRIGLYARALSTQEIIQNFYINYNPEASEGQEITSSANYATPLVRASFSGGNMNQTPNPTLNNPAPATDAPAVTTPSLEPTPTPAAPTAPTDPVKTPVAETPIGGQVIDPNLANNPTPAPATDAPAVTTPSLEPTPAPAETPAVATPSLEPTPSPAEISTEPTPTPTSPTENQASFAEEIAPIQKNINEQVAMANPTTPTAPATPAMATPVVPNPTTTNTGLNTVNPAGVKPVEL